MLCLPAYVKELEHTLFKHVVMAGPPMPFVPLKFDVKEVACTSVV
jgi:hypothetical protein